MQCNLFCQAALIFLEMTGGLTMETWLTFKCRKYGSRNANNKKVLLRERKRHTTRRVAIASPWGGRGGPPTKNFFPSLNMYQAKSGVKKFSLYWGGGSLDKKFFSQSEHVPSQIWCQKIFPLLKPGTPCPPDLRLGTPPPPGSKTGYPPRSETGYPPWI